MLTKCFSFSSKANKTRGFFVFFFFSRKPHLLSLKGWPVFQNYVPSFIWC